MDQQAFTRLKAELEEEHEVSAAFKELRTEDVACLTAEQAQELTSLFGYNTMIRLPERERDFFDWLRDHDRPVWDDLWTEEDEHQYYVSMAHLPSFLLGQRGFPICDLERQENFFFTREDIIENDGKVFVERALDVIAEKEQLSMDQAFLIEVWRGPIDQWRFAWMYNLSLEDVKDMVQWLIKEGILHVPKQRPENQPPIEVMPSSNGHTSHE
ncbi:MAG: hypothetical protein J4G05_01805 [Chlorobi bacterium]|nr:hypothetical protein [Chlorobiota bacterium]